MARSMGMQAPGLDGPTQRPGLDGPSLRPGLDGPTQRPGLDTPTRAPGRGRVWAGLWRGRRAIGFVYAAVAAGAAAMVTLSVEGGGAELWRSTPMTETAAQHMLATMDATPARLLLVPRRNVLAGTPLQSNTLRLSGISAPVGVAVSAGAEVSVAGQPFTTAATVAARGEPIILRAVAPAPGTQAAIDVTTGTLTTRWIIESSAEPAHSHQTLYGPWGACSAAQPCDGLGSQSRDILCLRSDGRFVEVTACGAGLTAVQTRDCPSPAGTAACAPLPALAIGLPTQFCAAGSATRGPCTGFTCPEPYVPQAGACVSTRKSLPVVTITAPATIGEEEGALRLTATADYAPLVDLVLPVTLAAGSLADGEDLAGGPWRLTLPAGQTRGVLDLALSDDEVSEPDEVLALSIGAPANGATLAPGSAALAITIIDDDTVPQVTLSAPAAGLAEGEQLTLTVTLSRDRAQAVTVPLVLGGAAAGDVSLSAPAVTMAPRSRSATVIVSATADGLDEPALEAFTVSIGSITPAGAAIAGAALDLTVADRDAEPTLSLSPATVTVTEGQAATATVSLSGRSAAAVSAGWAITPGTADAADFTTLSGMVVWGAGETGDRVIALPVADDAAHEPGQTFTLALTTATGASLATATPIAGTILDNDCGANSAAGGWTHTALGHGLSVPATRATAAGSLPANAVSATDAATVTCAEGTATAGVSQMTVTACRPGFTPAGAGCSQTARLLTTVSGARQWDSGLPAASCRDYRTPPGGANASYDWSTDKGDGIYRIDTNGAAAGGEHLVTCDMTTEGGGWTQLHDYNLRGNRDIDTLAHANAIDSTRLAGLGIAFSRVAYRMDLNSDWVWTSMGDFTGGNSGRVGIPYDWIYDQTDASPMTIINSGGSTWTGQGVRLEFWSNCYGQSGGNSGLFDHDDSPGGTDCYGSMQVHNGTSTIWAYNAWSYPGTTSDTSHLGDDVGIFWYTPACAGNPDRTYCYNSHTFSTARLRVWVR